MPRIFVQANGFCTIAVPADQDLYRHANADLKLDFIPRSRPD